jgi:branched-chain amino acid transport system permease protein
MNRLPRLVSVVAVAALVLTVPFWWSAFNSTQIVVIAIATMGLVVLSGQTGQISVAQGSFVGVGAYTTAVLAARHGVPALATVPLAIVVAAVAGLVIGIPTARLRGIYQVITTLAVGVAFPTILLAIGNPVGGSTGIPLDNLFSVNVKLAGIDFDPTRLMYFFCLACGLLVWLLLSRAIGSRHGTAMRAIRQNEVVAAVNGVQVGWYRVAAFVIAAACAGLAGSLSAMSIGAVSADSFGLLYSIQFLVAIALGGADYLVGAIVGSVAVFLLTTDLQGVHLPGSHIEISNEVVYGLAVIVVLLVLPGGLWGAAVSAVRRVRGPSGLGSARVPLPSPDGPAA